MRAAPPQIALPAAFSASLSGPSSPYPHADGQVRFSKVQPDFAELKIAMTQLNLSHYFWDGLVWVRCRKDKS